MTQEEPSRKRLIDDVEEGEEEGLNKTDKVSIQINLN